MNDLKDKARDALLLALAEMVAALAHSHASSGLQVKALAALYHEIGRFGEHVRREG